MKIKGLAVISIICVLCITIIGCNAKTKEDSYANQSKLPQVGDKIGGFEVKAISPMESIGATGILFEHTKNGAELMYIASDDNNVSFNIAFKTPALNEKGIPHVFEHITIEGSQKYPNSKLFLSIYNKTYKTYMNASTYAGATMYPLASLSQEQLFTLMDYYLSGVFQPLLYTEPRLVEREAWRYELNNIEDDISLTGIVYNEMQGNLVPTTQAYYNSIYTMFKNSPLAHISGGVPNHIRTLTYDELIEFHQNYYHPSNSLITLYGDMDYTKFITYIDEEYISKYDRKTIEIPNGKIPEYTQTEYMEFELPVELGTETKNTTIISYSFADNDMGFEDSIRLHILNEILTDNSSPIIKLLKEKLPEAVIESFVVKNGIAPLFIFNANGVNPQDRDVFVECVDEGIAQIYENGISNELFEALMSNFKYSLLLESESSSIGIDASAEVSLMWQTFGKSVDVYSIYQNVVEDTTIDYLNQMIGSFFYNNTYRGVTSSIPTEGLVEKNNQMLTEELQQLKNSLTAEQLEQMVKNTASFNEWTEEPTNEELVNKIASLTVDMLPEVVKEYDIKETTIDDVTYITTDVEAKGIGYIDINLDASGIEVDKLRDVNLMISLLGALDTKSYTNDQLTTLVNKNLGSLYFGLNSSKSYQEGKQDMYVAYITTKGLIDTVENGYKLVEEILLTSDFSDIDNIKTSLSAQLYNMSISLESPENIQLQRALAVNDTSTAYDSYFDAINSYEYTKEMLELAETNPQQLTQRLEDARELLLNKTNAKVVIVSNKDDIDILTTQATNLLNKLPKNIIEPVDYSVLRPNTSFEAVVNNSSVHMNLVSLPSKDYSGKMLVIGQFISDKFLLQEMRTKRGAYGAYSILTPNIQSLIIYRDPNFLTTFDVLEQLPEYLRTVDITQEELDSYIIGTYSSLVNTSGVYSQAIDVLNNYKKGITQQKILQWMKEAKQTTVEDIHNSADLIDNMLKNGVRSTSGTLSKINENINQFDSVVGINLN